MGEYANYKGESIKIGTCEDMYYLRFDQTHLVDPVANSLDPVKHADKIRFRFPFPDEDHLEPGDFDDFDRSIGVPGAKPPAELDHHTVQFVAAYPSKGYNVSLPCPESAEATTHGLTIHRNGCGDAVRLVQQRVWEGHLVAVAECGGCHARYRMPTLEDAQPVIDAFRAEGNRRLGGVNDAPEPSRVKWYTTIADRIEAGYGEQGRQAIRDLPLNRMLRHSIERGRISPGLER